MFDECYKGFVKSLEILQNPFKDDHQESVFMNKNKCRTPGLSKIYRKKGEAGKKQLSLTEMFSFKR